MFQTKLQDTICYPILFYFVLLYLTMIDRITLFNSYFIHISSVSNYDEVIGMILQVSTVHKKLELLWML